MAIDLSKSETRFFPGNLIAVLTCLLIFMPSAIYAHHVDKPDATVCKPYAAVDPSISAISAEIINKEKAGQLEKLIADVVTAERTRGNLISSHAILITLLNLDGVTRHGVVNSHRELNHAQYAEIESFLKAWLGRIKA